MYIANIIIGNKRLKNSSEYNFCSFVNVTDTYEDADKTLPTLFIGIENARKYFSNLKIYNYKLDRNIFWTFSKTECRDENEKGLKKFIEFVKKETRKNIEYTYFNIFKYGYNKIKNYINYINNKILYINNDMVYSYYNHKMIGISMKDIEYIGINRDKAMSFLTKESCGLKRNVVLKTKDEEFINGDTILNAYFALNT